ncbi:NAD(P)/FAD-dependent oxidoreductase [Eubacterium multiforme]|uniref:L-2-hydroxyglutarate oxidase LhgO n=1 Tax=Eubacterium multiforme TaxID=83339 RepID=A0ABT9UY79_9FIRM|nr:FAD-dependent oxidoreductase [Eubacterium multiforme]MDQ0151256.1 L-2-hydroxyglutarate oxidase LhgO [Eubacterium multiforme]
MDYDVLILGAGIVGCAVAYELSKYNLNIAVIEKGYDVADDIAVANTAIVYDGSETSNAVMAGLENIGSVLIKEACEKFKIPYKKIGSLRIATNEEQEIRLEEMYVEAKNRGILGVKLIDGDDVDQIEPNLKVDIRKALYSKNTAIIAPYDLSITYAEVAADNGVNFRLEEEVFNISKITKGFDVTTNKNKFKCRIVINTIPDEIYVDNNKVKENVIDNVIQKKMNYFLTEDKVKDNPKKIIVNVIDDQTFVINSPMINGGNMLGVKNTDILDVDKGAYFGKYIIPDVSKENITEMIREVYKKDEMVIDDSELDNGYIRVTGKHYGKITIAPAIAESIKDSTINIMNATPKKNFIDKRREFYRFRDLNRDEINEIIKLDKRYGNIVCICNKVSEGEIVDCIRRPLGARTLEGVKKRTGAGYGNCHGSYCARKIINILAREMDRRPIDIVRNSKDSNILEGRIKEFDEV